MDLITPDFGIIFWQTITFFVVLIILKKFAWKTIVETIKSRENRILGALESAKQAKKHLDSLEHKSKEIIDNAVLEGERVIKDAIIEKENIIYKAKQEAIKTSEEELNRLKKILNREKDKALLEMKNNITDLVLDVSEKLIRQTLSDKTKQEEVIENILKEL